MNSNTTRVIAGIAVVALAVVLLIVLQDNGEDDDDGGQAGNTPTNTNQANTGDKNSGSPDKPAIPTIVVANGKPVGGVEDLSYDAGERIRFKVRSDIAEEIHVHGYDIAKEVEAGGSVSFSFPADLEGLFEVELEERGEQIAELTVNP